MRMRQSIAQWEEAFHEEAAVEIERRARLRREAAERSRERGARRVERHGTLRFVGLIVTILATSVIVTWAMFEALAFVIGG